MPDKFRRCGNGCLRCWRNKLKHGVRKKSTLDFVLFEEIAKPVVCRKKPSKSISTHEICELWNKGNMTECETELYLDILLDRKPTKTTNYLIKVLSKVLHPLPSTNAV